MLTHCGSRVIETERLLLRPFDYKDWQSMQKYWVSDPKIQSMYAEPAYETKEEILGLLEQYIKGYEKEDYYRWAITLKGSDDCIGQIAFFMVSSEHHFAEFEYAIGSEFQRQGLVTEATKALISYGFNQINLHKIQVSHREGNRASQRVIEKCGFVYEGTLRDCLYIDGIYLDRLYYSILREEAKI